MNHTTPRDKFGRLQVGILKIHNKSYPVYEGINTVGRHKEAVVNIKHLNISQNHALVVIVNGNHFIGDLNSSNGTFLEDHKVEPFKLIELKNNANVKLGDVYGTYISQGQFTSNDQNHFEMTQDVTQSFYGSNTQILDNTKSIDNETEDIHDAPTQEISWGPFKFPKSIKPLVKGSNQLPTQKNNITILLQNTESEEEDIHNCATQVICDSLPPKIDEINKIEKLSDKGIDSMVNEQEPVLQNDNNEVILSTHNSANMDEDIHNAPTQILPLLSNKSNDPETKIIQESELSGPFNDEDLPLPENNDNYIENYQIPEVDKTDIHEAVTQVIDISTKKYSQITSANDEDDEGTDCEDNLVISFGNENVNPECSKDMPKQNTQDEVTDCEDNTQSDQVKPSLGQKNKTNFVETDDDSNDSMDFLKVERSFNKDPTEDINVSEMRSSSRNSALLKDSREIVNKSSKLSQDQCNLIGKSETENYSDENIHFKKKKSRHLSSSSDDDDDEKIGFRRKKKSSMIISTQDICETKIVTQEECNDDKQVNNEDNYLINDTDSETEMDTEKKCYLEESIAATQNQTTDLNDTDCIPATQHTIYPVPVKSLIRSPINITDNVNGSSEESFKLGLTELMLNPSQTTGNGTGSQDPCCSKSLKNSSPVFGEASLKDNTVIDNQSDDTDKTDIYIVPTQRIIRGETDSNKTNLTDMSDTYLAETQIFTNREKPSTNEDNILKNLNETECLYEMPTQKMDNGKLKRNTIGDKSQLDYTNSDIYFLPTQKVVFKDNKQYSVDENSPSVDTHNDIYFAPTQKVITENTFTDRNSSREESMDDLYLQPTQQLEDIFNQPTQKINTHNLEIDSDDKDKFTNTNAVVENIPNKKKFSFKKTATNLDGSLTTLLNHSSKQPQPPQPQPILQREDRSSIEFDFVENANASSETPKRPSNPLSYVLKNFDLDATVKQNEIMITETPIRKNVVCGDVSIQEARTEKLNVITECEDVKDENEIKSASKENYASPDKIVTNKGKTKATASISIRHDAIADSDMPTRSSRTSRSVQSRITKNLKNKITTDIGQMKPPVDNKEKNENHEKLNLKSRSRRTARRISSPSSDSINILDTDDKKPQSNMDQTDNSLNTTNSEVNQSIALLESRLSRTRKTIKSSEIQIKVPKNRKSMTLSKTKETADSKNVVKENISSSDVTKKKRGRPNRGESEECDVQGKKVVNKSLQQNKGTRSLNNNLETLNEKETQRSNNNIEATSSKSTHKVAASACSNNTRQGGKRKQFSEVKLENSDSSLQVVESIVSTPKKQKLQPSRQVGKRKQPIDVKSDNSDTSIQSADLTTPKKQKLQPSEALLSTKERGLRKLKPKVVFTMLENPQMESMIKQLGGSVIDSINSCSVLITEHVKRSQKLLSAVGLGKPICSPNWITDSKKAHEFLDSWDYILSDPEAEEKWNFSLKESLNRSRTEKILNSYNFQIMVTNAADVLKGAIESCGGKCISKIPAQPLENTFVISTRENQSKYRRITKQHPNVRVIEPEAIFDGVLRQELRFSKHYLT